jgi:hypothetical protein
MRRQAKEPREVHAPECDLCYGAILTEWRGRPRLPKSNTLKFLLKEIHAGREVARWRASGRDGLFSDAAAFVRLPRSDHI